jgi:hypothetical protein
VTRSLFTLSIIIATLASGLLPACGSDATGVTTSNFDYWSLTLNHRAIMLALQSPYDTVQLVATPGNLIGAPVSGLSPVTYSTRDTAVTVSPTGLVTARYATDDRMTPVVATLRDTIHGITRVDTALVVVTALPAPHFAQFSIQPQPGDSAKRSRDFRSFPWPAHVRDASGTLVCDETQCTIPVAYTSSNVYVAEIDRTTGFVDPIDTGHVTLTASTFAYGQSYRDTVMFRVGLSIYGSMTAQTNNPTSDFCCDGRAADSVVEKPHVIVGVGASFTWFLTNYIKNKPIIITFSPSDGVDTSSGQYGNVPFSGSGTITSVYCDTITNIYCNHPEARRQARSFTKPGLYQVRYNLFPDSVFLIEVRSEH